MGECDVVRERMRRQVETARTLLGHQVAAGRTERGGRKPYRPEIEGGPRLA